jgi:hypothetical protein
MINNAKANFRKIALSCYGGLAANSKDPISWKCPVK